MSAPGKTIHDLYGKVQVIADVLFTAGRIQQRTVKAVADQAGICYRTLQTSVGSGRVTSKVEAPLSALCGFDIGNPSWCDPSQSEPKRRGNSVGYDGADTADKFRHMLQRITSSESVAFRALNVACEPVFREFACHELTDCQQNTHPPAEVLLFLEATFGLFWSDGIRYGLRRARILIEGVEPGIEFQILSGRGEVLTLGDASLVSKGTSSLPAWELSCSDDTTELLEGEYRTTDGPLLSVRGYRQGTAVKSTLLASLHDGFLVVDPELGAVSANQKTIIELICAGQIPEEHRRRGIIELCHQELVLTDINHA